MSPEEVIKAVSSGNIILPAGNVRTGDLNRIAPINSVVSDIQQLQELLIRTGAGPTVFLRDVGSVENGSDILTGYALVNGRRTVYIPVTKRADASTLAVVSEVKPIWIGFARWSLVISRSISNSTNRPTSETRSAHWYARGCSGPC